MGKDVALFPATQNGRSFHKGSVREGAGDVDQTNDLGKVTLLLKFKLLSPPRLCRACLYFLKALEIT